MHPTPIMSGFDPVTPTPEQIAHQRDFLSRLCAPSHSARHLFVEGWLISALEGLAREATTPHARGIIARTLALVAAVEQLDTEDPHYSGREDVRPTPAIPAGVDGYPLGRYRR